MKRGIETTVIRPPRASASSRRLRRPPRSSMGPAGLRPSFVKVRMYSSSVSRTVMAAFVPPAWRRTLVRWTEMAVSITGIRCSSLGSSPSSASSMPSSFA